MDYLSLIETRYILFRMSQSNYKSTLFWLLADFVITVFLIVLGFLVASLFPLLFDAIRGRTIWDGDLWVILQWYGKPVRWLTHIPLDFFNEDRISLGIFGIFFYSTFFTSLWIWLFMVGSAVLRSLYAFPFIINIANHVFDLDRFIKNRPLSLLGCILIILASFGFVLFLVAS